MAFHALSTPLLDNLFTINLLNAGQKAKVHNYHAKLTYGGRRFSVGELHAASKTSSANGSHLNVWDFDISAAEFPQQKKRASLVWIGPKLESGIMIPSESISNMLEGVAIIVLLRLAWRVLFVFRNATCKTYFVWHFLGRQSNMWKPCKMMHHGKYMKLPWKTYQTSSIIIQQFVRVLVSSHKCSRYYITAEYNSTCWSNSDWWVIDPSPTELTSISTGACVINRCNLSVVKLGSRRNLILDRLKTTTNCVQVFVVSSRTRAETSTKSLSSCGHTTNNKKQSLSR